MDMNIFDLFTKAAQSLKWPSLHFTIEGKEVKISPTYTKDVLFISNGKGKLNGRIIYGIIEKSPTGAKIKWKEECKQIPSLRETMCAIVQSPLVMCKLHGLEFSRCCFCGIELTSKESLFAGYGPICAEKWGLPWGEIANHSENM